MNQARTGHVGLGSYALELARATCKAQEIVIAGCFSRPESRWQAFSSTFGCAPFPSYEASIESDLDDVVPIAPNHLHSMTVKDEKRRTFEDVSCPDVNPLAEDMAEFARAVPGRNRIEVDGKAGREAVRAALAAGEALESRAVISLSRQEQPIASGT